MEKEQTQSEQRPVLLFAFANDDRPGRRLDGLRREVEAIRRTLTPAEREGLCEIIVRESTTPDELVEVLEDPRYRRRLALIHFAGHATESRLLLEGNGEPVAARIQGLAPLLGELDNLALLFLNGCATVEQGRRLIDEGIPVVVATERTVEDTEAQRFAVDFYRALAAGASVSVSFDRALSQARCFSPVSGATRDLVPAPRPSDTPTPWRLLLAEPRGDAKDWSLPTAANDPLFGLPAPVGGMLPQEPFMGLRRFTARESAVFFGRGHAIRNLYQDVLDPKMPPVLVVYGASGAGKSSLLEAGLLPRAAATHDAFELRLERKQDPEEMLRRALGDTGGRTDLAEVWRAREERSGRPVVVCLDQLEVLVLEEGNRALARFIRALKPLNGSSGQPRGKLILGLRKEWFPELRNELRRYDMAWHDHFVEPLGRDDIEEIILGVTRTASMRARYGITCDNGLAARIADDLSRDQESAIAPMLQILLTRMWMRTEPQVTSTDGRLSRHFSMAMYDELRRDGLALSDFVDRQLEDLKVTHSEELASGLVLDVLYRHTTSRGTAAVCTYATLRELYAHRLKSMESLVERCIALYLLQPIAGDRGRGDGVRLAHDTLAPIIRDRHLYSKAPGQAAVRLLEARMGMAEASVRSRLLDEHDLEEVEAAQAGMRRWTEAEQQLVTASRRRRTRAAWLRRGRQVLVAGSVGVALIVTVLRRLDTEPEAMVIRSNASSEVPTVTLPSASARREEEMPADESTSDGARDGANPDGTAANDQVASDEGGAEPQARRASLAMAQHATINPRCTLRLLPTGLTGATARVETLSATAVGRRLAVGMGERNRAFVLEPFVAEPALSEIPTRSSVNGVAWSPDGQYLGIAQEAGKVQMAHWTAAGEQVFGECTGHAKSVRAIAFSRDGTVLVTGDTDGRIMIRDGRTCVPSGQVVLGARVEALAEGDGSTWMAAGSNGHWMTWPQADPSSKAMRVPLESGDVIRNVLARPAERWVLAAGPHLYSWSAAEPDARRSPSRSTYAIHWAFVAEDTGAVITASRETVDLWSRDVDSWAPTDTEPTSTTITGVAVSHDRRDVLVADAMGTVLWLRRGEKELTRLRTFEISSEKLTAIAVDPRMRYFVVGDHEGTVTLITLPQDPGVAVMCALERIEARNFPDQ